MIKIVSAALLGVLVLAQQPQGKVTQSELGAPGEAAPPPAQTAPAEPPPAQKPKATTETPKKSTPPPAPAPEPVERDRTQSGKPVAAFWIVVPGR